MVRVNGIEFQIYELDTLNTFVQRIAAQLNTLPKYLYFEGKIDMLSSQDIKVEDLLKTIKKNAAESTNFKEFIEDLRGKLSKDIDVKRDVLYVWLAYNTKIDELIQMSGIILTEIGRNLIEQGYFITEINFKNFWEKERTEVKKRLKDAVRLNKTLAESQEAMYEKLILINEGLGFTEFKTERVKLEIRLLLDDTSLLELFNDLVLNEAVPFATAKQYYKILKDFIPPEDWSLSEEEMLLLKVFGKESVDMVKYDEYSDVKIRVTDDGDILTTLKLKMIRGNLNRDELIARILQVFDVSGNIEYDNVKETEVVGLFYFPMERINSYVFSDLVMNNPLFSYLINIDESVKATKKKSESSQPWTYIHFDHPSVGHLTASINQKYVMRNDPVLKEGDSEIFPIGSPYIRVRVTGRDRNAVEKFQSILSKLLVIYGEEYNEIQGIYRQFIPNFGAVEEGQIEEIDMSVPENRAPDVFVAKYTRKCNPDRMPTVVTEEQAKKLKKEQVMKFPRNVPDKGPRYASDGVDQVYYACMNPNNPYPGLQVNKLENSEKYPFVPCCFDNPQQDKERWQHYFLGKGLKSSKGKKQQDLIKTDKILGPEKYGELPPDLQKLFELLDPDPEYRYIRLGVYRNYSSFLNTVMVSLYEETGIISLTDEKERINRLNTERNKLSAPGIAPLCRQSVYDATVKTVSANIRNPEVYFDPNLYLQLLEIYFNCNIFLFNRKRMILPRHLQSYYSDKLEGRPCIFVYEHWGSESDHAAYPQCELIVKWKFRTQDTEYVFPYTKRVSRGMRNLFSLLRQSYVLDMPLKETVFSLKSPITSQRIDSYGKCRQLDVNYRGSILTVLTVPIQPRATEETQRSNVTKVSLRTALDFLEEEQGAIISQTVIDGVLKEIVATIGNVNVTVLVEDSLPMENIPKGNEISYPESRDSIITIYNRNKKISRYLVEYCYWLFSRFLQKKSIENITDEVIVSFANKRIRIIPDFQYENIRKKFSYKGGVMSDKKLVVTSEEMLKRLLYVLRMYSVRDTKGLLKYADKHVIQNYYQDITDFEKRINQVILHGEESVEKWIQESKTSNGKNRFSYVLYNNVDIGNRSPYFFQNNLIGANVFLAQNIESITKAISIALTWQRQGYNESMYAEESSLINFTLYSYVNPNNIRVYRTVGGNDSSMQKVGIIGYKVNDNPFYTVLLPLS